MLSFVTVSCPHRTGPQALAHLAFQSLSGHCFDTENGTQSGKTKKQKVPSTPPFVISAIVIMSESLLSPGPSHPEVGPASMCLSIPETLETHTQPVGIPHIESARVLPSLPSVPQLLQTQVATPLGSRFLISPGLF